MPAIAKGPRAFLVGLGFLGFFLFSFSRGLMLTLLASLGLSCRSSSHVWLEEGGAA